ncbi:MAG: hypothetical protein WCK40_02505 [Thermoleophilia bacterium]
MGAITTLAKQVNRLAKDTREHHEQALDGGVMAILPSSPALGGRLSGMLGVPVGDRTAVDLLVIPLGAGDDVRAAALEVAARSRQNQRTLVVVVCAAHERGRIERELLAEDTVTIGDLAFVPDLESDSSVSGVMQAVIRSLGKGMVPAARRYPALRDPVHRHLVDVAARESAIAGALNWFSGSAAAQHAMVVRMGSAEGQGLSPKRIPEVVAATATGIAVGIVARGASRIVPAPRWMVRGAVAWASTVALAAATERISRRLGDDMNIDPKDAVKAFIRARLGRKGKS